MTSMPAQPFEALREALCALPATGANGFEGLIRIMLECATGIPFRLAASGAQGGVDAEPTYPQDALTYECKRYRSDLDRDKVLSKLGELNLRQDVDVWVLAATTAIGAQLARTIRDIGDAQALETFLLDWGAPPSLPPLGVLCAAVPETRLAAFLAGTVLQAAHQAAVVDSLRVLRRDPGFDAHLERLLANLRSAHTGVEAMRQANLSWLRQTLSDRAASRNAFGQPLAPAAEDTHPLLPRVDVLDPIRRHLVDSCSSTVLFVLGSEGVGKSWSVMQAWANLIDKPALFFVPSDSRFLIGEYADPLELLTHTIARQVGPNHGTQDLPRWRRRLMRWLRKPSPSSVRFVVYLDGINQQPGVDWARLIEGLGDLIHPAGGRIAVSSRTAYFDNHVADRLCNLQVAKVEVAQWRDSERDSILEACGLAPSSLALSVKRSLCNPRLLALALELFDNDVLHTLSELDVGRLLFEYIRVTNRDSTVPIPAYAFVERLGGHARELLARVEAGTTDDLLLFHSLDAVVEGHFFHSVDNDPTRYYLSEDGLRLALALGVIERLRTAHRNRRQLIPEVTLLIDPIAALDDVAGVLLSAVSVCIADRKAPRQLIAPLLVALAGLQNPDDGEFRAFTSQASIEPGPFMEAARHICLDAEQRPGDVWIKSALLQARSSSVVWSIICTHLQRWFRTHNFDPLRALFKEHVGDLERQAKLKIATERFETAVEGLSDVERQIVASFDRVGGDSQSLHQFGLSLCWSMPLAALADSFVCLALGRALDPSPFADYDTSCWVVWCNTSDWALTRSSLLPWIDRLACAPASRVGNWSAVSLLRMTGAASDARRAEDLVNALRPEDTGPFSWRLKETWCDTDPCDPCANVPGNLEDTIKRFSALPVEHLWCLGGRSSNDLFFEGTIQAMARFAPEVAIEKIRMLAVHVAQRSGLSFRQGSFVVDQHRAAITPQIARRFLDVRRFGLPASRDGLEDSDCHFLSGMCLSIAFPHVSGDEQLIELVQPALDENIYLHLYSSFKAPDLFDLGRALDDSQSAGDERVQCHLLSYMCAPSVALSEAMQERVLALCDAPSERVRLHALLVLADRGAPRYLQKFAAGHWSAAECRSDAEVRAGSLVLVNAVDRANVAVADVVSRVSPQWVAQIALASQEGARFCGYLLDEDIRRISGADIHYPSINVEIQHSLDGTPDEYEIWLSDESSEFVDQPLQKASEDATHIRERHQSRVRAFSAFRELLASRQALAILHPLSRRVFFAIANASPERIEHWEGLVLAADEKTKPLLHNVALLVAAYLAKPDATRALKLLATYANVKPVVHVTAGYSHASALQRVTWHAPGSDEFDELRRRRIQAAMNDYDLSLEVACAEEAGQDDFLTRFTLGELASEEPCRQARAIMVCGFRSDRSAWLPELARFAEERGLTNEAYRSAKYAFERNQWARHWLSQMQDASTASEYWIASELFLKVADLRIDSWRDSGATADAWYTLLSGNLGIRLRRRMERWKLHREKTLFGVPKPKLSIAGETLERFKSH